MHDEVPMSRPDAVHCSVSLHKHMQHCTSSVPTCFKDDIMISPGSIRSSGVLLQLLGCVLWKNWWPMLTGITYVLVPMPYIFFGSSGGGEAMHGTHVGTHAWRTGMAYNSVLPGACL